jgi:co-chaperonin GroES (HSP10)
MFDSFRPLGDRVLLRRNIEKNETESGIIMPGENEKPIKSFTVIQVGYDCIALDVGNTVYLLSNQGNYIEDDVVLISEKDILGKKE